MTGAGTRADATRNRGKAGREVEPRRAMPTPETTASRLAGRLRGQVGRMRNDPLTRTAWPLLINIGTNGVLGVLYWLVAARLFDPATVATNSAVLAAMTTLSGITQLNLGQTLMVYVPRAREHARMVIARVYAAVTVFGVLTLVVFALAVLPHLSSLSTVLGSKWHLAAFSIGVLGYNLFALQDAGLISLRKQKLVPIENASYGAAKLLLLVPLVVLLPDFGIYASTIIPLAVIIPVISWVIFHRQPELPTDAPPRVREPLTKLATDYVGYLFLICSTFLLPVVALELLPATHAAVFAIAWQTSSTVDLLASNLGTALTVETSYGRDPVALRRTILRQGVLLITGVAVVGALLAPFVLSLYGAHYRSEGVFTLRVLLLAGIPRCLGTFAMAEARAHRAVGFLVRLRAQNAVVAIGLSILLAPRLGLNGMAIAWLVAQLLSGGVALRRLLVWKPSILTTDGAHS